MRSKSKLRCKYLSNNLNYNTNDSDTRYFPQLSLAKLSKISVINGWHDPQPPPAPHFSVTCSTLVKPFSAIARSMVFSETPKHRQIKTSSPFHWLRVLAEKSVKIFCQTSSQSSRQCFRSTGKAPSSETIKPLILLISDIFRC